MKKITTYLNRLFLIVLAFSFSTKRVLADMLPPGRFDEVAEEDKQGFFDLVEPQYVLIAITIIVAIGISFAFLSKIRESEDDKVNKK